MIRTDTAPAYIRSRRAAQNLASRISALLDAVVCFERMAKLSVSPDHASPQDRIIHDHCVIRAADARRQVRKIADDAGLDYKDILRRYANRPWQSSPNKPTTPPVSGRKSKMRIANAVLACIFTLLLSVSSLAQNKVQVISSVAKTGSPVPAICLQQAQTVISIIKQFPHPDNWTWVVVCDEMAWQRWEQHISWNEGGSPLLALTDRASKVTYLRGDAILHPAMPAAARPEHVIAHELGHIMLNSSDESAVDKLAWQWQNGSRDVAAK